MNNLATQIASGNKKLNLVTFTDELNKRVDQAYRLMSGSYTEDKTRSLMLKILLNKEDLTDAVMKKALNRLTKEV